MIIENYGLCHTAIVQLREFITTESIHLSRKFSSSVNSLITNLKINYNAMKFVTDVGEIRQIHV